MNVRNCKKCGRIFNYIAGQPICPACREDLEKVFQKVKEYITDHGQADLNQISADCDVEISQLRQWIREERLTFSENSVIGIECESCGAIIKTGRFCDKCKADIAKGLIDATKISKPQPDMKKAARDAARMRFLDKH